MSNRGFTSRFRGFVALLCVLGLTLVPMLAKAASASFAPAHSAATGTLTVSGTVADAYEAYRLFDAKVADGDSGDKVASDIVWASDAVRDLLLAEITRLSRAAGLKGYEFVHHIALHDRPFDEARGLVSASLKLKRHTIREYFADQLAQLAAVNH